MASESVFLVEWLKQPGDEVALGDVLATIETDKSSLEVEATASGTLGAHRYQAESDVPLGEVITVILSPGETEASSSATTAETTSETAPPPADSERTTPDQPTPGNPTSLRREDRSRDPESGVLEPYELSPRARRDALAPESAPTVPTRPAVPEEVAGLAGTDLTAADDPAVNAPDPQQTVKAPGYRYRAAVGEAVSRSWAEIPHFAVQRELRVETLLRAKTAMSALQASVTFTDVLLKAYALSVMEHFGTRDIDLGLAVATDRGVAIPVLRDVARSDVLRIAEQRVSAVERAKSARLNSDDASTPHSTLSNLGALGVDSFTAIVPLGQTSILSVGAAQARPVVEDGAVTVGTTMVATLNVDHREWDGQHAAHALAKLAAIIAEPALLTALNS